MLKSSFSLLPIVAVALCGGAKVVEAQTANFAEAGSKALTKRVEVRSAKAVHALESAAFPDLSPEQIAIASRVALGKIPCELAAHVSVNPDSRGLGRFILELGRNKYSMVPVPTLTGAIRLEDAAAGVFWLQLSNKSMLMSQKLGKRLADDCASADQLIVAKELERNPAPSLLDAPVLLQAVVQSGKAPAPELAMAAEKAAN